MNNVILPFPNSLHQFQESITRRNKEGEQKYVCDKCGIVGWVKEDSETILIKRGNQAAIENCSGAGSGHVTQATMTNKDIGKFVRLLKEIKIGGTDIIIPKGSDHEVIECPKSHKKDHNMKVWIKYGEEIMFLYDSEREFVDAIVAEHHKEQEDVVIKEYEPKPISKPVEIVEFEEIVEKTDNQVDEHIEVMEAEIPEKVKEEFPFKQEEIQEGADDIVDKIVKALKGLEIKVTFNFNEEEK